MWKRSGLCLSLAVVACWGKVGREDWPELKPSPLLNQIHLPGVKWPEVLSAEGESAAEGPRRGGRRAWCAARAVQVRLSAEGCRPRWVGARLCQGQCTSVWVPRPGAAPWTSCPACRPVRGAWVSPALACHDGRTVSLPIYRVRRCGCREPGTALPPGLQ